MVKNSRGPFIKRFQTARGYYIYDINTNRILRVEPEVYAVCADFHRLPENEIVEKHASRLGRQNVVAAIKKIDAACKQENLLLPDRPEGLSNGGLTPEEYRSRYMNQLAHAALDITQNCNLNCSYCGREWNSVAWKGKRRGMSEKTAFAAIDFLFAHSRDKKRRTLSFYGGEPLLKFGLIQKCVDYAYALFGKEGIRFNITSNGLLIDRKTAQYLKQHRFLTMISIDGPAQLHDRHRKDWQGRGSYNRAVRGFKRLLDAYGDELKHHLSLNMVVTPPYDLTALEGLWDENTWLPKDMHKIDFVNWENTAFLEKHDCDFSRSIHRRTRKKAMADFKKGCIAGHPDASPVAYSIFEPALIRINKRPVYKEPTKSYQMNGCCVPGTRKVFVTSEGQLRICERCYGSPILGTVFKGYDHEMMQGLVATYIKESIDDCKKCWAIGMCTVCFANVYTNGRFDIARKRRFCKSKKAQLMGALKLYCTILEENPCAFDFMKKIQLK